MLAFELCCNCKLCFSLHISYNNINLAGQQKKNNFVIILPSLVNYNARHSQARQQQLMSGG